MTAVDQHAIAIADGTARYTWPGGLRFANDLPAIVDLTGLTVADLGSGRGVMTAAALAAGAAEVIATDGDPAAVAALTQRFANRPVRVVQHIWGDAIPTAPVDVIVGGDITYRTAAIPALCATIARWLKPGGIALLGDPRTQIENEWPQWTAAVGLRLRLLLRPGPYTLIVLTFPLGDEPLTQSFRLHDSVPES